MVIGDREDFEFGFTYQVVNGELHKLNAADEIRESVPLSEASTELMLDALEWVEPETDFSDMTDDELRKKVQELV